IMAQQPDLLLLDDYSIGLDAGYRRLFLDDMKEYLAEKGGTVFLTSHVIQDMVGLVDEVIFLERGGALMTTSLTEFKDSFHCYRLPKNGSDPLATGALPSQTVGLLKNVESHSAHTDLFSFASLDAVGSALEAAGCRARELREIPMSLEDAFIGYTGRY
ncbi:MAG: ABC transporter ATP-binding protein, partial [Desulfobacterales bacterium]|nr:ABC transporter ATP-binding protein [Desulfobacterales bacterium]